MIEILLTTLCLALLTVICLGIGHKLVARLQWSAHPAMLTSIAYILGFAVVAYTLVGLALVHQFNRMTFAVIALVYLLLFGRAGVKSAQAFLRYVGQCVRHCWSTQRWLMLPLGLITVFMVLNYFGCFAPPTARDEISYHLPEARMIINSGSLDLMHDQASFFANLPLLMEVIYAFAIMVLGYSLAHVVHYSLWLAFTVFIVGWLKKYFGLTTAAWAGVSIYILDQVVTTATTALVDAAFMVLEIISVCLVIDWLYEKRKSTLLVSGATLGLALSIKYSPLFTGAVLFSLIVGASIIQQRKDWKVWLSNALHFILPALVVGGFWYIKNLAFYGNPTYPLLFGHASYGEAEYLSLLQAIQDFIVPRTLWNYLLIPVTFYLPWAKSDYPLLSLSYTPHSLVVLFSLISLPWLAAIKKYRWLVGVLLGYMIAFSLYWFFIATHQERFLDTATIVLILLAVIAITQLQRYWKFVPLAILVIVTIGIGVRYDIRHYLWQVIDASIAQRWMRKNELYYLTGRISKATYLETHFGCGVVVLDYLDTNAPQANVLDNWTKWHDHQFEFYDERARFYPLTENMSSADVSTFIKSNNIQYIYIDTNGKNDFSTNSDPILAAHYQARISQEQALLATATLAFESGTCQVYHLNTAAPLAGQ